MAVTDDEAKLPQALVQMDFANFRVGVILLDQFHDPVGELGKAFTAKAFGIVEGDAGQLHSHPGSLVPVVTDVIMPLHQQAVFVGDIAALKFLFHVFLLGFPLLGSSGATMCSTLRMRFVALSRVRLTVDLLTPQM